MHAFQLAAIDLAKSSAWEFGKKFDGFGSFVWRQQLLAELNKRFRAAFGAGI